MNNDKKRRIFTRMGRELSEINGLLAKIQSDKKYQSVVTKAIPMLDGYKEFLSLRRYLFDFWNKHGMDECHKSYEGAFELLLSFPCYFDNGANKDEPDYFEITLHCYVLGPHRHYHWRGNNFKEVVKEARQGIEQWIKEEMEMDNEDI